MNMMSTGMSTPLPSRRHWRHGPLEMAAWYTRNDGMIHTRKIGSTQSQLYNRSEFKSGVTTTSDRGIFGYQKTNLSKHKLDRFSTDLLFEKANLLFEKANLSFMVQE